MTTNNPDGNTIEQVVFYIKGKIDQLPMQISELFEAKNSMTKEVTSLSAKVEQCEEDLDGFKTTIEELKKSISSLESMISDSALTPEDKVRISSLAEKFTTIHDIEEQLKQLRDGDIKRSALGGLAKNIGGFLIKNLAVIITGVLVWWLTKTSGTTPTP